METIKNNWKRYLISTAVTFGVGFAIEVVPILDTLTLEGIKDGTLLGLIFAGVRAGVKFVLEAFIKWAKK